MQLDILICVIDLQLVQARAMWMQELQKRSKDTSYWLGLSTSHPKENADYSPRENFVMHSYEDTHFGSGPDHKFTNEQSMHQMIAHHGIEKHSFNEVEFVDKSVIKEDPSPKLEEKEMIVASNREIPVQEDYDDEDDWLNDDSDLVGYSCTSIIENEEDISFSDLEDDLDYTTPIKYKTASTEENTTSKT